MERIYVGVDVGSISINTVVIDESFRVVEDIYTWCRGRPFHQLETVLEALVARCGGQRFDLVGFTGTGGARAAELVGGHFVNEVIAQCASVAALYPRVRSIIEMGGEDSKLIVLSKVNGEAPGVASLREIPGGNGACGGETCESRLEDFALNSICAAGTGSFLDQQARRMGLSIERQFGELALQSEHPPRIAGRCSVFAKSDMIHLQQIATPVADIVAGLCFAVARNVKSSLARGKEIPLPVAFQGGVAANAGMVRAFRELLGLVDGQLVIPEHHSSMGAIGVIYHLLRSVPSETLPQRPFLGLEALHRSLEGGVGASRSLPALRQPEAVLVKDAGVRLREGERIPVYLGLDIGSLSTNIVLIDDRSRVVSRRYLPTASRPLEAIQRGLSEIASEVGERVEVRAVGTTGSGRYLTGDFVGGDVIQNEITAQATAAIALDPTVDTIFEIGGQDSKYISVDDGVIVDFEMNKVCAAGTGSFLEEQAEKLGINIVEEFGSLALGAARPAHLGDRCTVFMESDLNSHQQKGIPTPDLVGGLAYSIVMNYMQKVVAGRRVGNRIFFQGGVANNRAVIAAFEAVTGKTITVPPHFDVTGAIGAAMLARTRMRDTLAAGGPWRTRFKGFEIGRVPFGLDRFTCTSCSNQCEIRKVSIQGEARSLFYGGRCEKWERDERKGRGKDIPNLFEERMRLLLGDFQDGVEESAAAGGTAEAATGAAARAAADGIPRAVTIGIPRALMIFYQQFPFWRTFFEELGFRVVLSGATSRALIQRSLESVNAETCFPVEVVHGHVLDLLQRGVDYVFAPFVVSAKAGPGNPTANYNCPWIQTYPFMLKAALRDTEAADKLLMPALHFRWFDNVLPDDLAAFMTGTFGLPRARVVKALALADDAQVSFERAVEERGRAVLRNLPTGGTAAVILGRPYNTGDPALNLGLVEKLIALDVLPVPTDYLPLSSERVLDDYHMMCWPNGQKILAAARFIAKNPGLTAISIGNFRCGPDSFISHYLRQELAGRPFLQLEVDEHSADAGMVTRLEAFLDSQRGRGARGRDGMGRAVAGHEGPGAGSAKSTGPRFRPRASAARQRTLYFPYMNDGAYAVAAASRSCGVEAQVLPMQDEEDLKLARRYTSGRECFPMICTLGSFLRKVQEPGTDPSRVSFFMPDHGGPCRFGQYNKLMRIVLDSLGFADVQIVAPTNENAYAGLSGGHGNRFRLAAVRGVVACDLLRKMKQERTPYETEAGETQRLYLESLQRIVHSVEEGARDLVGVMAGIASRFRALAVRVIPRKPVIAVVGEIFMRDNPFCSGFLVSRLESLGAETFIAPFSEWLTYSTLRYARDSRWKRDLPGRGRARLQAWFTDAITRSLCASVGGAIEHERDVPVQRMLQLCSPYIHRDYDGDPALAMGMAEALASTGISGVAHILPFSCLPGTTVTALSHSFRKDHDGMPWLNFDYDGQEDTALQMRLQPFVHQAAAYCRRHGLDKPRKWGVDPE